MTDSDRASRPDRSPSDAAQPSDNDLIALLSQGNRDALSVLFDRHAAYVYTIAKRILASVTDAESIVSDVFFELWRSPEKFDPSRSNCRTYLVVLARSRAIDRLRSLRLHREHSQAAAQEADSTRPSTASPEQQAAWDEDRQIVRQAVESLSDDQSKAIWMAFFDGKTHDQIARELDVPLGTIKSRIRAGLKALQNKLDSLRRHDDAP